MANATSSEAHTRQLLGSLLAAIVLIAAVVAVVSARVGPGGIDSRARQEQLDDRQEDREDGRRDDSGPGSPRNQRLVPSARPRPHQPRDQEQPMTGQDVTTSDPTKLRHPGKVAYLELPAVDPPASAAFYEAVFGWTIRGRDSEEPHFDDAAGDLIGAFMRAREPAGEAGGRPYIYVASVDATLAEIEARGCEAVRAPFPEGDLWVATFRDPSGNVIGIWQMGPRGT